MQVHPDFEVITIKRKSDGKLFTLGESIYVRSQQCKLKAFRYNPTGNTVKLVADVLTTRGEFLPSIDITDLRG